MREETNSPDSDDSFGFARRKSNFVDIGNGVSGGTKSFQGDKKEKYQNEDLSRTTPATIAHSRHGGREPPSLVVGLSDTAANLMLSTTSDEEEEGDGRQFRNLLPDTSIKEVPLSLNTTSQLPQQRAQSAANSPRRRTRPLSSQCHTDASIPVDNGFSTVSLSMPFLEKTVLKTEEHKQDEIEDCSTHTAFKVSPKTQHDTYLENRQPEQLESQDVVNVRKTLMPSSQKMEEPDGESRTNQILMNENRRLKRRIIDLKGTVEQLNQQIAVNMEQRKCVQTSQKEQYESAMTHLKELHKEEIVSLRQQTYELPTLQVKELLSSSYTCKY